ncbi:S-layer homology domain-containing protein [Bacillus testis]|uniref:S-layer homology domain-containing protein n=1 Tax=Bacillus testis TaxID=1622072 RepID=UPI00067F40D8|nr:S-layer homology domain-containing protein [Bacillus testis]
MAYQPKAFQKFIAGAMAAALVASPTASAGTFTDVAPRYGEAVDFLLGYGIQGISTTKFGVPNEIKRVDAAIMLAKVLELDIENAPDSGFTDVPKRGVKYINALKEQGITVGKTTATFDAHSTITRGELAVWIQRGFGLEGDTQVYFSDVAPKYVEAVSALVENGITDGITETQFGTGKKAKRGDYAIFLMRAFDATFNRGEGVGSWIQLNELDSSVYTEDRNIEMPYHLYDEYGEEIRFFPHLPNEDGKEDVEVIDGIEFTSSNPVVMDVDSLSVDEEGKAFFDAGVSTGTAIVTAKSLITGQIAQMAIDVADKDDIDIVPPVISSASIRMNPDSQIIVEFIVEEEIDLSVKPGNQSNVILEYQVKENGEYVTKKTKNKTWPGYLKVKNEDGIEEKYGPGLLNDSRYKSILPAGQTISTSMSGNDWLNDESLRIILTVKDRAGNSAEKVLAL